ncbi:tetratricopeptide repeat protein [Fortiea sp. LEGE XX443]|uniref:tetratricopeptide repeat protein n=1 Tax=Fortiea sp. LEGE XX443 TaxID=1828611 RepID=UPI001881F460|nr:tetratricopeptide repeat protein [Fortiea sp. LEGE XX443]MBE9007971.1 tetratricopeptide repeat protein [Fortiea sp. LEGE XX443]
MTKKHLSAFGHRTLVLLVSVLVSSELVMAKSIHLAQKPASTPQNTSPEKQRAATQGQRLLQEAQQLYEQGTATSRQEAIAKYEEALKIWRTIGDRSYEATTLLAIGTLYFVQNDNQKALGYFQQGLVIRRELKDRFGEAVMLSSVANAYSNLGEPQKALEFYSQALRLFRAEKKPSFIVNTLIGIGGLYFNSGQTKQALEAYNKALVIQREQKNLDGQANILQTIGITYTNLGETQKALDAFQQALEIQRARNDIGGQADALNRIGIAYLSIGDEKKALESLNQSLKLQQQIQGNLSGIALAFNLIKQAAILTAIGGSYSFSEPQKALDYYNQGRSLLQKAGNPHAEAELLGQVGLVYDRLGEKQKALDVLNQALTLQRATKNRAREAFTLDTVAGVYASLGDYQKAINVYNQAINIQREVKDISGEGNTLKNIALVYSLLGDNQASIKTYNQALEKFKNIGDRDKLAQTLDNIGSAYRALEDYPKALEYYNQARQVRREQGNIIGEVSAISGIVRVYEALKDYPKALDAANQILTLAQQTKNGFAETSANAFFGRVYLASGDYAKALDSSQKAATGWQKLGQKLAEANVVGNLAKTYNALKQPQQAIATYNQELKLRQTIGDRTGEADTLYYIAQTERDQGNLNAALTQIETTIKIVEDIRTNVTSQDLRTAYFASVQKYYQFYIDLLMRLHKQQPSKGYDALALQVSERARARSLLDLLTEANADIRQGVNPKLLQTERNLQQQLDAREKLRIQLLSGKYTEAQVQNLDKKTEELLQQYQQVQAEIRNSSPRYAALTQPQPLSLKEIQQQVLDDNTLLLEYSLGEERSYLWAVSKNNITSYELPKRAEIATAIQKFRDALTAPSQRTSIARTSTAAKELSQIILAPIASQLGKKRLVIVGDGALQYVPITALAVPNSQNYQPLVTNHEIITLPSASTIALLRQEVKGRKKAPKTIAVLADPVFTKDDERLKGQPSNRLSITQNLETFDQQQLARSTREADINFERLRFTRQEAEEILSLVSNKERKQAFDFTASRDVATSPELSQYQIIHFATHGILNSTNPELSGVVLSLFDNKGNPQNGFLRLHDIFNLNLPAELVVLSACETGLGEEVKGEGLVGLTRGFMYAGSPRVVVSLWSVDDEATSELMKIFYANMLRKNLKPAAALRAAQIEMSRNQNYAAPYYWAAFTLQGEWK